MPGPWQIAIIVLVVLVLFGRGKISGFMGDLGKGITSFKKGIKEGEKEVADAASLDKPEDKVESKKEESEKTGA